MIIAAQSTGTLQTNSPSWTPMPGLAITLPRGVGDQALVILNVPNPYAQGNDYPGGYFALQVAGNVASPIAAFTYNEASPASTGRVPTTLTIAVPLSQGADIAIVAVWHGVRGSTVIIDTPAMLSAVV